MIKKIASLKGHIDCPFCFSYLEWNDINDIQVFNGNKYIVCPECGKNVYLNEKEDYWDTSGGVLPDIEEEDEGKILQVVDGVWSKVENSDTSEETWTTVFEGEVTTDGSSPYQTELTLTKELTATNIRITFDGQHYECNQISEDPNVPMYGANINEATIDWSVYPFSLAYIKGRWILYTETDGVHSLNIEQPEEAGGSSDFSTATLTIINQTNNALSVTANTIFIADDEIVAFDVGVNANSTNPADIVLFKGVQYIELKTDFLSLNPNFDGDISLAFSENIYEVTGDCTITVQSMS